MAWAFVVLAWTATGALVGWLAARHGHWHKLWVLTAVLGPLAVPLVVAVHRRAAAIRPRRVQVGAAGVGTVDVLVGVDGSPASLHAALVASELLGPRVGRLTLASVLDYDTATPHSDSPLAPERWAEEERAEAALEVGRAAVERSGCVIVPETVVLAGDPADALQRHAIEGGYDVVVVGCRGRGASKLLLGSCAGRLVRQTVVPVLVASAMPSAAPGAAAGAHGGSTASAVV